MRNFRNLADGTLSFQNGLNGLVGANGQGKTNCLEALYFAMTSKSFRVHQLADLACDPKQDLSAGVLVQKGISQLRYTVAVKDGRSTRLLGGKTCKTLDFFRQAAVIAFTARDKNLVEGSPDDRRRFLDRLIAYLEPEHMLRLSKYRKIHNQCRHILKRERNLAVYRGFKQQLVPIATEIATKRCQFLESIRERTLSLYGEIFSQSEQPFFRYRLRNCDHLEQLPRKLMDVCAQELLHGRSLVGPHLDDLGIRLQDKKAKPYASSGQIRSIVLSLKLAVRETYYARFGHYPIFLLDDIDAELDIGRLSTLFNFLQDRGQTMVSTSKYGIIKGLEQLFCYEVQQGHFHRKGQLNDN